MKMKNENRKRGYPSRYKATYENGWDIKNVGYDYSETLIKKTLSNYLFKNPMLSEFLLNYLNPIMVFFLNRVKYIRVFYNYAVPKDYQKIN